VGKIVGLRNVLAHGLLGDWTPRSVGTSRETRYRSSWPRSGRCSDVPTDRRLPSTTAPPWSRRSHLGQARPESSCKSGRRTWVSRGIRRLPPRNEDDHSLRRAFRSTRYAVEQVAFSLLLPDHVPLLAPELVVLQPAIESQMASHVTETQSSSSP